MAKVVLQDLDSLANQTTAIALINNNNTEIEDAIENTLSRDGTSPNTMGANIDMNGYKITNLAAPTNDSDAVRKVDIAGMDDIATDVAAAAASAAAAAASASAAASSATAADNTYDDLLDAISTSVETFTGDGADTTFTLSVAAVEDNTMVFVNGVYQDKDTWSISGTTLTFSVAPANTASIEVLIGPQTAVVTTSIAGVTGLQAALDAKAALAGATFTGGITGTTASFSSTLAATGAATFGSTIAVTGTATFSGVASFADGSVSAPAITNTGDTNCGIYWSAADTISFAANGVLIASINGTGVVFPTELSASAGVIGTTSDYIDFWAGFTYHYASGTRQMMVTNGSVIVSPDVLVSPSSARLYCDGSLIVSADGNTPDHTSNGATYEGVYAKSAGQLIVAGTSIVPLLVNRMGTDGQIINLYGQGTLEGSISVSGTTVTYGSFCGTHWSQPSEDVGELLRGTVLESVDEMAEWGEEVNITLPKFKLAGPGSKAVYGVFAGYDDDGDVLIASLGAFNVRVRAGEIVKRGDLLDSAGGGVAKVQADDIVRASTLAKVTSDKKVEVYPDGSYLVPVTLHCG